VTSPTLVLHTRDDRAVPLELGQEIAASIRGVRFKSYPGAHLPSRDVWKDINRAMIEFVTGQTQTPPSPNGPARVPSTRE
jgi:pimeloyl-ACP methyl ester carboxylesterase